MSWKAEANKVYEERVLNDALTRLAARMDIKSLPLSDVELRTLAKRFREAFYKRSKERLERLERYQAHLARTYGDDVISNVAAVLEAINNEIGYEEK
jgi:hypothetical protein